MQVRTDFAERVADLCASVPRPAVANLLAALMPRQPIAARKVWPQALPALPEQGVGVILPEPDPLAKLTKRVRKSRKVSRNYRVLNAWAETNHRRGSWRRAMVECCVQSTNEADALEKLAARYPHFVDKGIDFSWCRQVGYIV